MLIVSMGVRLLKAATSQDNLLLERNLLQVVSRAEKAPPSAWAFTKEVNKAS
jgi:hypothetical protein